MADIFFSYSRRDRERVGIVRSALAEMGFEVFWDQETPSGSDWDTWIRGELAKSKCAVVFWSATSIVSDNVRHEAVVAKEQRKLISVFLDQLPARDLPMGFYSQQAADLSKWDGDQEDTEWRKFRGEFEAKLMPRWVHQKLNRVDAELEGERARRETAEAHEKTLRAQISKEAKIQQELKGDRDRAVTEVGELRASVEERDKALQAQTVKQADTEQGLKTERDRAFAEVAKLTATVEELRQTRLGAGPSDPTKRWLSPIAAGLVLLAAVAIWQGLLANASARVLLYTYLALASSDTILARMGTPIVKFLVPENLPKINLSGSVLQKLNLNNLSFGSLNMANATIEESTFVGTRAKNLSLEGSTIQSAKFMDAIFQVSDFGKAKIHAADFENATLVLSSFQDADINYPNPIRGNVKFNGTTLQNARFDRAVLSQVGFVDANLQGALFSDARLIDVDFSGAHLNYASFVGASFAAIQADGSSKEELARFEGSSWWLARGWTPKQFAQLMVNSPRERFIPSPVFSRLKADCQTNADAKNDDWERAMYQNAFARFLAICGENLGTAEQYAKRARDIAKRIVEESSSLNDERARTQKMQAYTSVLDTLGYILIQQNRWEEAEDYLRLAVGLGEPDRILNPETYYKYAAVLWAEGKIDQALEMMKRSVAEGYNATHEHLLLRHLFEQHPIENANDSAFYLSQ